ncbi:MAG: VOC family protein [Clostridia bacterium]|nr:VOC family protein [Clostridia bacterium]
MSNFLGLEHIGIMTDDIEASKNFYMSLLDFEFDYEKQIDLQDGNTLKIAFIRLNDLTIELLENSTPGAGKSGNDGACDHFTIKVKNLDFIQKQMESRGVIFEQQPRKIQNNKNGAQISFFRGPSGERIELMESF